MGKEGFEPTKPLASDLQSEVTLQRYRLPKNWLVRTRTLTKSAKNSCATITPQAMNLL